MKNTIVTFLLLLLLPLVSMPAYAEYGDVILNNLSERSHMRPVIFPHWIHRIRYKCNVCHSELGFRMHSGATRMTMADIMHGKYCGACHNGKAAWDYENCLLCHSGIPGLATGIRGGDATGGPGKW